MEGARRNEEVGRWKRSRKILKEGGQRNEQKEETNKFAKSLEVEKVGWEGRLGR